MWYLTHTTPRWRTRHHGEASTLTLIAASLASAPELQKNTRSAQLLSTNHFASWP